VTAAGLPDLLTVEEAARLIRVGRTKAYAMTQEWRATNGRSGLPVVDFGNVLRVPRKALEQLVGAELSGAVGRDVGQSLTAGRPAEAPNARADEPPVELETPRDDAASSVDESRARRPRRRRTEPDAQLQLIAPPPPTT
jgi:hypothetical protein